MSKRTLNPVQVRHVHRRGAAAIMAMMFLVIFGSLAAAMAIVAQGNLATAESHIKVNRALAAAETGMRFVIYRLNQVTTDVTTRDGVIDETNAPDLWDEARGALLDLFLADTHNLATPVVEIDTLTIGPIAVGPGEPTFRVTMTPHPLVGEDYDSGYYQRPPYSDMDPPVSALAPLDATWVRVRVEAIDGSGVNEIARSIQIDFRIDKKIRYAILSKSRVMIGRNVMIDGQIGSRFMETDLPNGHPVQMLSDFYGMDVDLDFDIDALLGTLILNDTNGDNRINLAHPAEIDGMTDPQDLDTDGDGYVDEYDFFLAHFDANADGQITGIELSADSLIDRAQLLELIDTFGDPNRAGYNDGVIDHLDRYTKIRGQVAVTASMQSWNDGAAGGAYQDFFKGPIIPEHGKDALTFQAGDASVHKFESTDFDVTTFRNKAVGNLETQSEDQAAQHDPDDPESPQPLGETEFEAVPYGAAHPYDHYDRPIYENMTFTNIFIPQGSNALFRNCTFIGVTYIETSVHNDDPNFNFVGMQEADGSPKHEGLTAAVDGQTVSDTKTVSNNVRFEGCRFEGSVVTDASPDFSHVRNKIAFTGSTQFVVEESTNLTDDEKALYRRSTILAPHYSVEMGSFADPADASETVKLTGTIVAGVLDMRGQVDITGTILTTFEPVSNESPVIGETSPQFNTTIGYFDSASGDLESELPAAGIGVIKVRYDPSIPLPDGILGPIEIEPILGTYFEGGGAY